MKNFINLKAIIMMITICLSITNISYSQVTLDKYEFDERIREMVWNGGLRSLYSRLTGNDMIAVPEYISFYRCRTLRREIDWTESFIILSFLGSEYKFVNLRDAQNELKNRLNESVRQIMSKRGIMERYIDASPLPPTENRCNLIGSPLSMGQILSLINEALRIDISPGIAFINRASINLSLEERGGRRHLRVEGLEILAKNANVLEEATHYLTISDWLKECIREERPEITPRVSLYYTESIPVRYYFDPMDINNILRRNMNTNRVDIVLEIIPHNYFGASQLPIHTVHRRNIALLASSAYNEQSRMNPLYNTSLKIINVKKAFWQSRKAADNESIGIDDHLSFCSESIEEETLPEEFDYYDNPGFYSFEAIDTFNIKFGNINQQDNIYKGAIVVLPELKTTNFLTSLENAVSDIYYDHVIEIPVKDDLDSIFQVVSVEDRFVMDKLIECEIDIYSKNIIRVEIIKEKDKNRKFYPVRITCPIKENVDIFTYAKYLNSNLYWNNEEKVVYAYFRYLGPDKEPLQKEEGYELNGEKGWHRVEIRKKYINIPPMVIQKRDIPWWITALIGVSSSFLITLSF